MLVAGLESDCGKIRSSEDERLDRRSLIETRIVEYC